MILTTAHGVDAISYQSVIWTYAISADVEIMMTLSHLIAVEEDLFRILHIILTAAIDWIFLAFFVAGVIIVAVSFYRIRDVVLFDTSYYLII